ncbi:MAG: primosomal protein N' [Planctomycetota bacterium]
MTETQRAEAEREPERIAQVVLEIPADRAFDYAIPEGLRGRIRLGARVSVPFGRRHTQGFCVGLSHTSEVLKLKEIEALLDPEPLLSPSMLRLTRWMADYYACSWGESLSAALPGSMRKNQRGRRVRFAVLVKSPEETREEADRLEASNLPRARILQTLIRSDGELPLARLTREAKTSASPVNTLAKAGWVGLVEREEESALAHLGPQEREEPRILTGEQAEALEAITRAAAGERFGVSLLFGVTGSGKTEVYLQALAKVVSGGRQAIVLVPEIALTPQTVSRFRRRFERVAVWHSALGDAERRTQWQKMRCGEVDVVIGARSAIFAPLPRLGLIVIDEEHESSFKQSQSPRYHARDVGIVRARLEGAHVILGSATPSMESTRNCEIGKYELVRLRQRVGGGSLPGVQRVDMRQEIKELKRFTLVSRQLLQETQDALARKEQVILFLNRRGFSTAVLCTHCGTTLSCQHCDVPLTFHKGIGRLLCHYCFTEQAPPKECPTCQVPKLVYKGFGTQKVEEELRELFPEREIFRADSDTMKSRRHYEELFERMGRGEVEILIGTQMIAKGLDFPNVSVVGVLAADAALSLPDFRASERTFQLIAQVAGRAGRGPKGGVVIVQSFDPDHFALDAAARHDYGSFYREELELRKELGYPPFSRLLRIVVQGKNADRVRKFSYRLKGEILSAGKKGEVSVLGAVPAPIAFLQGKHRWHLLVKADDAKLRRFVIDAVRRHHALRGAVRCQIDVDPYDLL